MKLNGYFAECGFDAQCSIGGIPYYHAGRGFDRPPTFDPVPVLQSTIVRRRMPGRLEPRGERIQPGRARIGGRSIQRVLRRPAAESDPRAHRMHGTQCGRPDPLSHYALS